MSDLIRVRDLDTGHVRSVHAEEFAHGRYERLDEPAVDPITGDVVPPVLADAKPGKATKPGQPADPKKEN